MHPRARVLLDRLLRRKQEPPRMTLAEILLAEKRLRAMRPTRAARRRAARTIARDLTGFPDGT